MELLYVLIGCCVGAVVAAIVCISVSRKNSVKKSDYDKMLQDFNDVSASLRVEAEKTKIFSEQINQNNVEIGKLSEEKLAVNTELTSVKTEYGNFKSQFEESKIELQKSKDELFALRNNLQDVSIRLSAAGESSKLQIQNLELKDNDIADLKKQLNAKTSENAENYRQCAELKAINDSLNEKLLSQRAEIEELNKKFTTEFENIANKILDTNSEKFTKLNSENLTQILKPLGENIESFRKKVEESYNTESKERFSLGEEVKKLVAANAKISEEANNLTKALQGNSKIQGDWGQMILENILENSGLRKGFEYSVQEYLKDENGNYLKNEFGNKMQPDVIVNYPDKRKIIIDSKVSLTAYSRYMSAEDKETQNNEIRSHIVSIKKHIDELSVKNYQDFAPTLDFVMMFIPNEPAYILALQNDNNLWQEAYSKRVLLISPTNLVAALKLIENLWKRDYQNKNALAIAERATAMLDKLANFVSSLLDVGNNLDKTKSSYDSALNQLKSGKGNLIAQAEKLRDLGVKSKKEIPLSSSDIELNL